MLYYGNYSTIKSFFYLVSAPGMGVEEEFLAATSYLEKEGDAGVSEGRGMM